MIIIAIPMDGAAKKNQAAHAATLFVQKIAIVFARVYVPIDKIVFTCSSGDMP